MSRELTPAERRTLLAVARRAIAARLSGQPSERPRASGALAEPRGAFVSLHRREDGELRGCVGRMASDDPLVDTVAQMAVAASTEDDRFDPVRLAELDRLSVEISALGPLRVIRPDEVEVGVHGLMVSREGRRGVLLPQVPVERRWDRETFLAMTCRKAGLPEGAWREADCELLAFTAEVFGEEEG